MKNELNFVRDAQFDVQTELDAEIESMAQEVKAPRPQVAALYVRERTKLEQGAKIKTYVQVLARRKVKSLLKQNAT